MVSIDAGELPGARYRMKSGASTSVIRVVSAASAAGNADLPGRFGNPGDGSLPAAAAAAAASAGAGTRLSVSVSEKGRRLRRGRRFL